MEPDFWVQPKYVVTVSADEITRSPMHTCGREETRTKPAMPSGSRGLWGRAIREDKGPEDATTTEEIIEMFKQQKKVGVKER